MSQEADQGQPSILASSAVMAAGTVVSRMSGFVRSALLAAALGVSLHADLFNIANTIPTMLYILLAGGIFNAVLVPQLVRAQKNDPDGGAAYTNRVVTLAALFLGVVTVALVVAAPQVMSLFLDSRFDEPDRAAHLDSIVAFARFCLPQVFLYGMFVLVGQILNARGKFGPMMWAPIANNVIAVGVLVVYLLSYGPASGAEEVGPFTDGQEALLGVGSTVGILVQLLVLLPYLRKAGFTFRPRFDFAGAGLGHTFRLAVWTVLFVVVNQVAYTVVVRLASGGTADGGDGTGYSVYSSTFLIVMVPHSIVTVSLATAVLPALSARAADGDLAALATSLASTLRTALAVVVPFAALLPVIAVDLAHVIWGYGAAADDFDRYAPSLAVFGPGLVFFTVHYLVLRGFYALEQTRVVFLVQCVVAATNIALAVVLVGAHRRRRHLPCAGGRLRRLLRRRGDDVVPRAVAAGRRPRWPPHAALPAAAAAGGGRRHRGRRAGGVGARGGARRLLAGGRAAGRGGDRARRGGLPAGRPGVPAHRGHRRPLHPDSALRPCEGLTFLTVGPGDSQGTNARRDRCRTRRVRVTSSATATCSATSWSRAAAAGSGGPTTGSSSATSPST